MKSLKASILAVIVVVATNVSMAQAKMKKTPAEKAMHLTERMTKELDLTTDQQAKVSDINHGIAEKNEAVRNHATFTPAQKKEALQGNNDGRNYLLKGVLTPEQMTKYEESEAIRKQKIEAHKAASNKPSAEEEEEL